MKNIVFFLLTFLLIGCGNANANKDVDRIISLSKNEELKELLKHPVKVSPSPSKDFYFVYTRAADPSESITQKEVLEQEALKKDYNIDGFKFDKGEYEWCFIFDVKKKKIIKKYSNYLALKPIIWDEKNYYLIIDNSIGYETDLDFDNLKKSGEKYFSLYVYNSNPKSYLFNSDSKYIAYETPLKMDEDSGMVAERVGINIWDIEGRKDIVKLSPSNEKGFLEILKWDGNKLIYKETDKNKNTIKELSYTVK